MLRNADADTLAPRASTAQEAGRAEARPGREASEGANAWAAAADVASREAVRLQIVQDINTMLTQLDALSQQSASAAVGERAARSGPSPLHGLVEIVPTVEATGEALQGRLVEEFDALSPEQRKATLAAAFGDKAAGLDLAAVPPVRVEFVGSEVLGSARGAYSAEGGVIYLNRDQHRDAQEVFATYVEEFGHHIDATLGQDSAGDEGAIFRLGLEGKGSIDLGELAAAKGDDDTGVVEIDGRSVTVEFRDDGESDSGSDSHDGSDSSDGDRGSAGESDGSGSSRGDDDDDDRGHSFDSRDDDDDDDNDRDRSSRTDDDDDRDDRDDRDDHSLGDASDDDDDDEDDDDHSDDQNDGDAENKAESVASENDEDPDDTSDSDEGTAGEEGQTEDGVDGPSEEDQAGDLSEEAAEDADEANEMAEEAAEDDTEAAHVGEDASEAEAEGEAAAELAEADVAAAADFAGAAKDAMPPAGLAEEALEATAQNAEPAEKAAEDDFEALARQTAPFAGGLAGPVAAEDGSYQVAQAAGQTMTDAMPSGPFTAPAADAEGAPARTGPSRVAPGLGLGLGQAAQALEGAGLQNLNARDIDHLAREHGIALDPRNPVDAEIAMDYTLDRGRSELTRAIADNVWSGYAPQTVREDVAVANLEEALEERAAERSAAAIAAVAAGAQTMPDEACAPGDLEGQWEAASRPSMSPAARDYQSQIARTPALPDGTMVEYRVSDPATGATALFDGCAYWSPERELLEAKHGYGRLFEAGEAYGFEVAAIDEARLEAQRQAEATRSGHPVEWHVSDPGAVSTFQDIVSRARGTQNFTVQYTPAP